MTAVSPMPALQLLHSRVSLGRLTEPGPTPEQLLHIQQAALRVPDHARLRPWRFLIVTGAGRERLGELLAASLLADQPQAVAEALAKERLKPLRAPMLIVAVARIRAHAKVPAMEQLLSAGCSIHAMLLAAHAQGLGAIWRTGPAARDTRVHRGLGLGRDETIAGFLYLGTPAVPVPVPESVPVADYFRTWP